MMKTLQNYIRESFFDIAGDERIEKGLKKDTTEMLLKSFKGNFKTVYFKDGSARVNGKLIISDLKSTGLYLDIKDFHGKLIIENCPALETLEGSFLEKIAVFDGSITINQCPSLISVKGLPSLIKGDLSITNCKKLKSCEGIDTVFGNIYWSGNGKKYTEEQLKSHINCVIKKVFCGEDAEEANVEEGLVTETFNNQWLQRLAAQFKKYPYKEWSWDDEAPNKYNNVDDLFSRFGRTSASGRVGRLLDKITNDDIDVYDMSDEGEKKDLGKVFYNTYSNEDANAGDLFLIYNEDQGEFVGGFGYITSAGRRGGGPRAVQFINIPHKGSYGNKVDRGSVYSKSEAREYLMKLGIGYTVIVINSGKNTGTDDNERYEIRKARAAAQAGVITPGDVEQYKKIAADNLKRYKDELAKIKLARKKNDEAAGYDKVIDQYEQIQTRIIKLVRAIAKDPKSFDKYTIGNFLEWCRDSQRSNPHYKPWSKNGGSPYYGQNGLLYYFKQFMDYYMACFGSGYYKSEPDESDYKYLETATNNLKKIIGVADEKLKRFGF